MRKDDHTRQPAPPAIESRPRLAALWAALEPPAAEPAPPGFTGRVMARVREEAPRRDSLSRRFGVLPGRLAAASALAAGLVAGAGLGALIATPAGEWEGRPAARRAGEAAAGEGSAGAAAPAAAAAAEDRPGDAGTAGGEGAVVAERTAAGEGPGAAATAAAGLLDDDALLAAAVAAAASGEPAGEAADDLDAGFAAEPDLAGDYLAALAALGEAS